jgi:hypothetical protein
VAAFRILIGDTTVYEGAPVAVPHNGDDIHHNGEVVRVEAVTWDFATSGAVQVTLVVGKSSYTF